MRNERLPPNDPRAWLNRARGNLVRASTPLPGAFIEDLCFDAQQAAEKSFKAIILARGMEIPHTHDLTKLLAITERAGLDIPEAIKPVTLLTDYAVIARYPSCLEPVSDEEYRALLALAELAVVWATEQIEE